MSYEVGSMLYMQKPLCYEFDDSDSSSTVLVTHQVTEPENAGIPGIYCMTKGKSISCQCDSCLQKHYDGVCDVLVVNIAV